MEKQFNPNLLTEQEFAVIEELQNNPDPNSRLRSNYYQLRQLEILTNYQQDIAACNYYGDRVKIQETMLDALNELHKEYIADLNHAIALYTSHFTGWVPWARHEA